jgi:translation initiation factor 2B subunit (eIF-2B alpha/beta/delta family)
MTLPEGVVKLVKDVSGDHVSGATGVTQKSAECVKLFAETFRTDDVNVLWQTMVSLGQLLVRSQPEMFSIYRFIEDILQIAQEEIHKDSSCKEIFKAVVEEINCYFKKREDIVKSIGKKAAQHIRNGEKILVHSYSGMVMRGLEESFRENKNVFEVVVTESRPGFEGRLAARRLAEMGIKTTFVVDSAALYALDTCDKVIVGSDLVASEFFINKIGTRALALESKNQDKDFFVICDTSKWVKSWDRPLNTKRYLPDEVWDYKNPNCVIENIYFEKTPLDLVTGIICENGTIAQKGFSKRIFSEIRFRDLLL